MKIDMQALNFTLTPEQIGFIERRLNFALGSNANRINRVEVYLTDIHSPNDAGDYRCLLRVKPMPAPGKTGKQCHDRQRKHRFGFQACDSSSGRSGRLEDRALSRATTEASRRAVAIATASGPQQARQRVPAAMMLLDCASGACLTKALIEAGIRHEI